MDAFHVRCETDTAHPQDIVPIYPIHCITQPFCSDRLCWCHGNRQRVIELLAALQLHELVLTDAASLNDQQPE